MTSKLRAVFPDNWQHIVSSYKGFVSAQGMDGVNEQLLLALVEVGVRFGERLSRLPLNGFVEFGCGLGIPSLTLAKLGHTGGKAVDLDPKVIAAATKLKSHLGCELEIECYDIFNNRPTMQKGEMLVAEKPLSYQNNPLEVEYNLSNWCKMERHHLALIPSYLHTDTMTAYSERCAKYEKGLRQVGFKVENQKICDLLPFRWIIATK